MSFSIVNAGAAPADQLRKQSEQEPPGGGI